MTTISEPSTELAAPEQHLSLFDSTNIIVGIIIGSAIYEAVGVIASNVADSWWLLGIWALGGVLSLLGALCYTELATTYPKEGGDYVYLTKAFGRRMGFIFAWCQLWIVRPGSIGAMAYVFASYAHELVRLDDYLPTLAMVSPSQLAKLIYAVLSVLVLSGINILGVRQGKLTQNILTVAKFVGLAAVCVIGLGFASHLGEPNKSQSPPEAPAAAASSDQPQASQPAAEGNGKEKAAAQGEKKEPERSLDFGLALILVLFAYGGWSEMAYVGAEVRNPRKNILRALLLGTVAVAACYLVANLAFLHCLGFDGLRSADAPAAAVLKGALGEPGGKFISLLICVSALGAINGLIFTGARIYYAMGTDHKLFASLGQWNQRLGTPVQSLVIQAVFTLLPVVIFGLAEGAFTKMVIFTTPFYWVFMVLVALALYQLRETEPNTPRPYRVRGYPFTPFIFAVSSLFVLYRGVLWAYVNASYIAFWILGILVLGVLLSFYDPYPSRRLEDTPERAG